MNPTQQLKMKVLYLGFACFNAEKKEVPTLGRITFYFSLYTFFFWGGGNSQPAGWKEVAINKLPRINFHSILLEDQGAPRFQSNFEFAARIFPPTNDALLIVVLDYKTAKGFKVSTPQGGDDPLRIWKFGLSQKEIREWIAHILEKMVNLSGTY